MLVGCCARASASLACHMQIPSWTLSEGSCHATEQMCKCGLLLLQYVLGKGGVALMLIIIFMAVTSAGSSEFMAVGSLFTFDIYKVNYHPWHSENSSL